MYVEVQGVEDFSSLRNLSQRYFVGFELTTGKDLSGVFEYRLRFSLSSEPYIGEGPTLSVECHGVRSLELMQSDWSVETIELSVQYDQGTWTFEDIGHERVFRFHCRQVFVIG